MGGGENIVARGGGPLAAQSVRDHHTGAARSVTISRAVFIDAVRRSGCPPISADRRQFRTERRIRPTFRPTRRLSRGDVEDPEVRRAQAAAQTPEGMLATMALVRGIRRLSTSFGHSARNTAKVSALTEILTGDAASRIVDKPIW